MLKGFWGDAMHCVLTFQKTYPLANCISLYVPILSGYFMRPLLLEKQLHKYSSHDQRA